MNRNKIFFICLLVFIGIASALLWPIFRADFLLYSFFAGALGLIIGFHEIFLKKEEKANN